MTRGSHSSQHVWVPCSRQPGWAAASVLRCPREPWGSTRLSDEVCGGPGGDWGPPPKAQPQAEMALGIGLRLPVCPSEPVIHALGQGPTNFRGAPCHHDRWAWGSCQEPQAGGHCVLLARPLAGTVPAMTKCLQFPRNMIILITVGAGWVRGSQRPPEACPVQCPAPRCLKKEAALRTGRTRALGARGCESQTGFLLWL